MDVRNLGDVVSLYSDRTQADLQTAVSRLSSGLRINNASDDPSGLAIAEKLQTKVNGLDQGAQSVQDANNALNVADGALQSVEAILQRMRALVVQANSDVLSTGDLANIQAEIDELTKQVNVIAQDTTFNGQQLLDGSLSSKTPLTSRMLIAENDNLTGGGTVIDTTFDPSTPTVFQPAVQAAVLLQVQSYDPTTNQVFLRIKAFSNDPSFGPTQDSNTDPNGPLGFTAGTDFPTLVGSPPTVGNPSLSIATQGGLGTQVLAFNVGTLNAADVGSQAIMIVLPAQTKAAGQAAEVNSGDGEGTTVSIDIPAVNTINLAINNIVVGDTDTNTVSEYEIDYGINQLAGIRATVGAQIVSMQETANDAAIDAVNSQAAESAIRDTDIGQETTAFTKDQILVNLQTAVLSKLYGMAPQVLALVRGSAVGGGGI